MACLASTVIIVAARRFASATLTIKSGGWSGDTTGTIVRSSYIHPDAVINGEEDELMTSMTTSNYETYVC